MQLSKAKLAAAVGMAIGLGLVTQAQANIYAGSRLLIQNLVISSSNTGAGAGTPGSDIGSFQFTATNTATLNGVSDTSAGLSANCGGNFGAPGVNNDCGAAPALNALAANAPGSTVVRADGNFAFFGTSLNTYSNSDSEITSAELTGDATTATSQIAETELQSSGNGNSNAEITSNTNLLFAFSVGGPDTTDLTIEFEADPNLFVAINSVAFQNGNTQANVSMSITLSKSVGDDAGSQVSWSPQGTAGNDCSSDVLAWTCTELNDEEDLNRNLATGSNPVAISYSDNRGASADQLFSLFGITIEGLTAGEYTLALSGVTSTSVRQEVPLPGTLMLLGAGLAAVGARRRKAVRS